MFIIKAEYTKMWTVIISGAGIIGNWFIFFFFSFFHICQIFYSKHASLLQSENNKV